MPAQSDPVEELGGLLADAGATPRFDRKRVAASTLYDANYHIAIVACALQIHLKPAGSAGIPPAWLKLLQFLAARPSLVGAFVQSFESRRKDKSLSLMQLPRAYLGDHTHDMVIELLVAGAALMRGKNGLAAGPKFKVLSIIATQVGAEGLFVRERAILERLKGFEPTKAFLGAS
jgi:hypothetical protein